MQTFMMHGLMYIKRLQKMFNTTVNRETTPNDIILGIHKADESEMLEDYYPYEKARTEHPATCNSYR